MVFTIYIVSLNEVQETKFESGVSKCQPFCLPDIIVLNRKYLHYLNWFRVNVAIDDLSTSSGIRSPGGHWWDYHSDVRFILVKSLPSYLTFCVVLYISLYVAIQSYVLLTTRYMSHVTTNSRLGQYTYITCEANTANLKRNIRVQIHHVSMYCYRIMWLFLVHSLFENIFWPYRHLKVKTYRQIIIVVDG